MPERTLPIPVERREFFVKVSGTEVPRTNHLLSVAVTKSVNKISWARIVYEDGSASRSDFPLSNSATFVPGAEVEIRAGSQSDNQLLFKGIVVKESVKVRDHTAPSFVIECRHKAVRLTLGRRSCYWEDKSDGDIITELFSEAGMDADVASTSPAHKQQVQYRSTDWDFLLARAEANGLLVLTNEERAKVEKPDFSTSPQVSLAFGATLLELDADIDARTQQNTVKAFSWNPSTQAVVKQEGSDPGVGGPGNFSRIDLAGVAAPESFDLKHASAEEEELQAWADAERLRSEMNRACGRAKCEGIGTIQPGARITLAGVGERFKGDVFVTGVRQTFDLNQGWKTHVQFGSVPGPIAADPEVAVPKAGALLPGVTGLQIGVVTGNEDPLREHRVRVNMPLVEPDGDGTWARVCAPDAGDDRGFFFRPEIGDEVVVGFLEDDPRAPVVLGMLNSSAKEAPLTGSDANHEKAIQSRSKMKIYFNDERKILTFETPAGNKISLSEDEQGIFIEDQSGNTITMTAQGITIESATALELKAATSLRLVAGSSLEIGSQSAIKISGASSAELSSAGITSVKGALVQLN